MLYLWSARYGVRFAYDHYTVERHQRTQKRKELDFLKDGGGHAEVEFSKLDRIQALHADIEEMQGIIKDRTAVHSLVNGQFQRNVSGWPPLSLAR